MKISQGDAMLIKKVSVKEVCSLTVCCTKYVCNKSC